MKIAIVTDAWHPQTNGVVTTLSKTVEGLRKKGHTVEIIHPGLFRTVPCPTYPDIRLALFPFRNVARLLDAYAPNAIHLPTEGPLGFTGRHYCEKRKIPFTTTFTTKWPDYIQVRFGISVHLTYKLIRWFHRPATRTMVATPSLKRDLEEKGLKNLVFWGRGVDSDLFKPRSKDAIDAFRPIGMYMGRVAVEKNIEAFLNVKAPGTKVVIGDGPAMQSLREKYPAVRFLGKKTGEDLAIHLAAADVFVFPSLTDTFGIVMIEAMACGLPIAAYPVAGPNDVVIHGETGWLDKDLNIAFEKALEMSPERCRQHALQFSWEKSIDQFEANLAPIPTAPHP
ncbi:MAG: glycosyltransferase family 1 protein [Candidatus Omnitrophota bacterium]|jgi:glycosyltransferase involved in cell wall biosynthesis|nr:MAG: glycosyltransferase family 1 protein [Candidatus Omnitrophota bacterium]